ncbi:amidohydrolase family protein [Flavisolibacter sp. BT320]|nr:amidohydrolase family protein [Flavisolibacter longurius]
MATRMIDTHLHVWNFEKADYPWLKGDTSLLNRTFHLEEVEEEQKKAGVIEVVLVQSANNLEDTDWMLEVAEKKEIVSGVVGWLPLQQPEETERKLAETYSRNRYFKGIRHLIHDEADPQWLLQESVIESLKILASYALPFDVVGVLPKHIETVLTVAEKVPGLRMVFDHLNQPPIASGERFGRWGSLMQEAAANPAFHAKISGLGTTTKKKDWTAADIEPYVAFALEHFGTERCFCGGDWPVSLLAGSYTKTWVTYQSVLEALLDKEQQEKVYAKNAVKFYNL